MAERQARAGRLGSPRVHLRETASTNMVARELATRGAVHGTLVSAACQTRGRGRQGRSWSAPAGSALLCSLVVREPGALLSLAAGVAVADVCGEDATVKWPNDVLVAGRKVAGILAEGRPQERWAVLGIGLNVAVRLDELPPELRERAGTLGLAASELEPVLARLLARLAHWLAADDSEVLGALRRRDALLDRVLRWDGGSGRGCGIDPAGRLVVRCEDGSTVALDAGEVHLTAPATL